MTGDAAVLWTARLALALLTVGFVGRNLRRGRLFRAAWALGAATMWAHLAAAFHFAHGWSHADAVRETARQTAALTGVDWGGGVWINYLFAAVWTADAARRLRTPADAAPDDPAPGRLDVAVGAFLGFIAVNGAVVFEDGATRWVGVGCVGLVLGSAVAGRRLLRGTAGGDRRGRGAHGPG